MEIRAVSGYDDLKRWVNARNSVRPDDGWTPEMLALLRATEVDRVDLMALEGDEVAGIAFVAGGPVSTPERTFAEVIVVHEARRRGVGGALLDAVLADAASRRSETLEFFVRDEEIDANAMLERRGFELHRTLDSLGVDLSQEPPPAPPLAEGVELGWLNERPSAVTGMYALAHIVHNEAEGALPRIASTMADWEAFELGDPKVSFELSVVALADEQVVGYGIVHVVEATRAASHRVTAVLPEWRRRGIATAMTQAQIVASNEAGLRSLEGWARNEPIRGLAEKLGYRLLRRVNILRKAL
jgi:ribosomal protein S18 acetylase RimI-like enzyme